MYKTTTTQYFERALAAQSAARQQQIEQQRQADVRAVLEATDRGMREGERIKRAGRAVESVDYGDRVPEMKQPFQSDSIGTSETSDVKSLRNIGENIEKQFSSRGVSQTQQMSYVNEGLKLQDFAKQSQADRQRRADVQAVLDATDRGMREGERIVKAGRSSETIKTPDRSFIDRIERARKVKKLSGSAWEEKASEWWNQNRGTPSDKVSRKSLSEDYDRLLVSDESLRKKVDDYETRRLNVESQYAISVAPLEQSVTNFDKTLEELKTTYGTGTYDDKGREYISKEGYDLFQAQLKRRTEAADKMGMVYAEYNQQIDDLSKEKQFLDSALGVQSKNIEEYGIKKKELEDTTFLMRSHRVQELPTIIQDNIAFGEKTIGYIVGEPIKGFGRGLQILDDASEKSGGNRAGVVTTLGTLAGPLGTIGSEIILRSDLKNKIPEHFGVLGSAGRITEYAGDYAKTDVVPLAGIATAAYLGGQAVGAGAGAGSILIPTKYAAPLATGLKTAAGAYFVWNTGKGFIEAENKEQYVGERGIQTIAGITGFKSGFDKTFQPTQQKVFNYLQAPPSNSAGITSTLRYNTPETTRTPYDRNIKNLIDFTDKKGLSSDGIITQYSKGPSTEYSAAKIYGKGYTQQTTQLPRVDTTFTTTAKETPFGKYYTRFLTQGDKTTLNLFRGDEPIIRNLVFTGTPETAGSYLITQSLDKTITQRRPTESLIVDEGKGTSVLTTSNDGGIDAYKTTLKDITGKIVGEGKTFVDRTITTTSQTLRPNIESSDIVTSYGGVPSKLYPGGRTLETSIISSSKGTMPSENILVSKVDPTTALHTTKSPSSILQNVIDKVQTQSFYSVNPTPQSVPFNIKNFNPLTFFKGKKASLIHDELKPISFSSPNNLVTDVSKIMNVQTPKSTLFGNTLSGGIGPRVVSPSVPLFSSNNAALLGSLISYTDRTKNIYDSIEQPVDAVSRTKTMAQVDDVVLDTTKPVVDTRQATEPTPVTQYIYSPATPSAPSPSTITQIIYPDVPPPETPSSPVPGLPMIGLPIFPGIGIGSGGWGQSGSAYYGGRNIRGWMTTNKIKDLAGEWLDRQKKKSSYNVAENAVDRMFGENVASGREFRKKYGDVKKTYI